MIKYDRVLEELRFKGNTDTYVLRLDKIGLSAQAKECIHQAIALMSGEPLAAPTFDKDAEIQALQHQLLQLRLEQTPKRTYRQEMVALVLSKMEDVGAFVDDPCTVGADVVAAVDALIEEMEGHTP